MFNINEEDLKKAVVTQVSDEILSADHDLSALIAKEVKARLDKIFIDRAQVQIELAINEAIKTGFEREYQRVDKWGNPTSHKTTISAELEKIISGYWNGKVDPKTGRAAASDYQTVTRAEWVMTQICAEDFSAAMKTSALNITGALKDGLRVQMAKQMDDLLNGLFHVKSLQDQGKVEKPY
jgi:hypothetical protein